MNLVLTGIMGSGKSSVGRMLAVRLKLDFVDMDEVIEERYGAITVLFERDGEDRFRDMETAMARELAGRDGLVISTGGGIIKRSENMEALKKNGLIFFLDRPAEVILKGLDVSNRPLIRENPMKLHEILKERYPLYQSQCHYLIDASGTYQQTLSRIIDLWNHHQPSDLQFEK
jgi:shikimate kinase